MPATAADWPPTLDDKSTVTQSLDGRTIERFTHGPRPEWGYPETASAEWQYSAGQESGPHGENHNSFYLVSPRKPRKNAPLCVVLHSANRTAFDYLGYQFLNRKVATDDQPGAAMVGTLDDAYVLYLNSTNEEWWGWSAAHNDPVKYAASLTPTENRVFDTIAWIVDKYKIDRNRVYLSGVSMGGCGSLGIGLSHGDIFAAIFVTVPAGTEFAALRMGFPPAIDPGASSSERDKWTKRLSGVGLPDPPVLVDFSAQNDTWSKTQPELLRASAFGHLPLILAWAPFGHTAFSTIVGQYPQDAVTLEFPWMEIRKNAAYPVFTNATSNQRSPWEGSAGNFDESGQLNAYFRWKNEQDKNSKFAITLWLAHPIVKNPPVMPEQSTTDVTLRRLQAFQVVQGKTYAWRLMRDGKVEASGKISPNAANLLTIPRITVTTIPAELSFKPEN